MAGYLSYRAFVRVRSARAQAFGRAVGWALAMDLAVLAFTEWMIVRALGMSAGSPEALPVLRLLGWRVSFAVLEAGIGALALTTLALCGAALWVLVGTGPAWPTRHQTAQWTIAMALCAVPVVALWFKGAGLALGLDSGLDGFVIAQTILVPTLIGLPIGVLSYRAASRLMGPRRPRR